MYELQILIAGFTAIILFVYGIESFSREIEGISGERFRSFLADSTRIPIVGVLIGALVTAVIQSSSATSIITISLVNAGVLSFKNSVGIIFGANIGTTITAQLVAFKLTYFAPFLIIAGFLLSIVKSRYSIFSKSIFYFGFVFFTLNLISSSLSPLQNNEYLVGFLHHPHNPLVAILMGCAFTALIQSSSVTTGLAIIFTQQGILGLENAVPIIMGANIGTTATALLSIVNLDAAAKKTAFSHLLFNVGGVVIFLPVIFAFKQQISAYDGDPAIALATIHLAFNLGASMIFILFINPFSRFVEKMVGEGKMDFERIKLPEEKSSENFSQSKEELLDVMEKLYRFVQENYNLTTLALETNFRNVNDACEKRLDYIDYVKTDLTSYLSSIISHVNDEESSRELVMLFNHFDYLFQIHDSTRDLFETKLALNKRYVELRSDTLGIVRAISSDTIELFDEVYNDSFNDNDIDLSKVSSQLQQTIDKSSQKLLSLMADSSREDVGYLMNFVTYSQRAKDKLINFYQRRHKHNDLPDSEESKETEG